MKCFKDKCNEEFEDIASYRIHLRHIHNQNDGIFRCTGTKCHFTFTSFSTFSRHLKNVHDVPSVAVRQNNEDNRNLFTSDVSHHPM